MDLHERQQFDHLLHTATDRFVARLEERCRGPAAAASHLRADPAMSIATVEEFVAAIFRDFLLDNVDGAAFVLRALPKRPLAAHRAPIAEAATVEEALEGLARGLFGELLLRKTLESLDQHAGYQAAGPTR